MNQHGEHHKAPIFRPEEEARAVAAQFGVPVNTVHYAEDGPGLTRAARELGGPVALKLIADGVVHKASSGLVRLSVGPSDVAETFEKMRAEFAGEVLGATVERMVLGGTEVVLGGLWDDALGPVVMAGRGGVDIERMAQVTFAMAPLSRPEADEFLRRSAIGVLMESGSVTPAAFDLLVDVCLAIGGHEGLLLSGATSELDLNPLVVTDDQVIAVDVRMGWPREAANLDAADPATQLSRLTPAVYPESIAVVGASSQEEKIGHRAVRYLVDFGFEGPIYPIRRGEQSLICGLPSLGSPADLPAGVDRAVLAIPAPALADAVVACQRQGVKTMQILAAISDALPEAEEAELRRLIAESPVPIIGPNTNGLYNPRARLTMVAAAKSPRREGSVAFISQSGTYAAELVRNSFDTGLGLSFVASCGDCTNVTPADLLAFSIADPRTQVIGVYLETSEGAGEFLRVARTSDKPIFLLKGGRTAEGARAAASHTGALATTSRLFEHCSAQAGVTMVRSFDEMQAALMMAEALGTQKIGERLALVGAGGGVAVVASDHAADAGFSIPSLSAATVSALDFAAQPGTNVSNPIDLPTWVLWQDEGRLGQRVLDAVLQDEHVDAVIAYVDINSLYNFLGEEGSTALEYVATSMVEARIDRKPLILVLRNRNIPDDLPSVRRVTDYAVSRGVPVFGSVEDAVLALGQVRSSRSRTAG